MGFLATFGGHGPGRQPTGGQALAYQVGAPTAVAIGAIVTGLLVVYIFIRKRRVFAVR